MKAHKNYQGYFFVSISYSSKFGSRAAFVEFLMDLTIRLAKGNYERTQEEIQHMWTIGGQPEETRPFTPRRFM